MSNTSTEAPSIAETRQAEYSAPDRLYTAAAFWPGAPTNTWSPTMSSSAPHLEPASSEMPHLMTAGVMPFVLSSVIHKLESP